MLFRGFILKCAAALALGLGLTTVAMAQGKGLDEPFRASYKTSLDGKLVGFIPEAMHDLAQGWYAGLKKGLEPMGVKVVVRDPNWNTAAGAQAFIALMAEKPAAIVIHNPDVQTFAKLIKQAEGAGIYVVQINMRSVQRSTAFVGADWVDVGEITMNRVVESCKGKSGKVAVIQGSPTAAASAYNLKGVENVLAQHPEIKVVANQAADWDASKAKAIMQTVLKQHPDLCGAVGFWDGMDSGTAAAIQEAGLRGKVFMATSGGGEQKGACDQVKSGAYDFNLSYDVPTQAEDMVAMIKWLLQGNMKPGAAKQDIYTTMIPITKANASVDGTCWKLGAK